MTLRVFIDKNFVEVFANDRQAVVHAHKTLSNPNVRLFATGGDVAFYQPLSDSSRFRVTGR